MHVWVCNGVYLLPQSFDWLRPSDISAWLLVSFWKKNKERQTNNGIRNLLFWMEKNTKVQNLLLVVYLRLSAPREQLLCRTDSARCAMLIMVNSFPKNKTPLNTLHIPLLCHSHEKASYQVCIIYFYCLNANNMHLLPNWYHERAPQENNCLCRADTASVWLRAAATSHTPPSFINSSGKFTFSIQRTNKYTLSWICGQNCEYRSHLQPSKYKYIFICT